MNDNKRREAHPPADKKHRFTEVYSGSSCRSSKSGHYLSAEDYEAADQDTWETVILTGTHGKFIHIISGEGSGRVWTHSRFLVTAIRLLHSEGGTVELHESKGILRATNGLIRAITRVAAEVTPCEYSRPELPKPLPRSI
ncbi:hypothetical protein EJ997_11585 [Flaviflexus ciconiae]|uniref:Uncharacterized protein n=1 Tax=Flaviflexus ciconiae TaxID=2496867 RepID=A0A3Q9G899_9ACTO|nr:hypothetical protein [Flaviflexus ciconiae]AZQ77882.1 hypothetical protein EJ997_11585 [Flaviflexus ciconiae]